MEEYNNIDIDNKSDNDRSLEIFIGKMSKESKTIPIRTSDININKDAVKLVPQSLACKYCLIPIGFCKGNIVVLMQNIADFFAIDDVRMTTRKEVIALQGYKEDITMAISTYYSDQMIKRAADELTKEQKHTVDLGKNRFDENESIKNSPSVRLVDKIVIDAIKKRASDIHIEPFKDFVRVRYRIDGELMEVLRSPKETQSVLVSRVKVLADIDIAEKRLPQDGKIITEIEGQRVDLRVSTLPTVFGEKVVIRILSRDEYIIDKDKLGICERDINKLQSIISSPSGIFLIAGPTGSGKSTTLYTFLNELNNENRNIITVEDPVECLIEGINQININMKMGLDFALGLHAILRQDPDVIMIGEIRDSQTAQIAVRAAITGHLVLSTIHTNDSPSAILRLEDMGIEPYLIANAISGVLSQRLVKKICPHCRKKYKATEIDKYILGINANVDIELYRGAGCRYCMNSGYKGRTGVYEVMSITNKHREYISSQRTVDEIRYLSISNGMIPLRDACKELVISGITTIEEMKRIIYVDEASF